MNRTGHLLCISLCSCLLAGAGGCALVLPATAHRPVIRNPFPQLSRVAVAPFFNHSDEPTVDGRQFALAYFSELQSTPGFEVVPLGVVEEAIIRHRIDLSQPAEARRLAGILGVDAVVVGSVTDFAPYYPPRCGLRVDWYTANIGFHEIPVGYGLPWNTPDEEFIPDSLVYESQLALARSQMAELSPACESTVQPLPAPPTGNAIPPRDATSHTVTSAVETVPPSEPAPLPAPEAKPPRAIAAPDAPDATPPPIPTAGSAGISFSPESYRPEATSPGACVGPPAVPACPIECIPYHGPVLSHTRIYRGNDPDVTEALRGYVHFQDDARFGGWEGYLQRSDDFVRFCCHLHISEMLSARGGSRKTSVVWRWPENR